MSLRAARCAFTFQKAQLILWAAGQGYEISEGESFVQSKRKVRRLGASFMAEDAVHMKGSLHYEGLAADLNLYIDGEWISDGGDPAWTVIGEKWERMGKESGLPLAWGGRFESVDSNHISYAWGGRK